ncbi:hypothetical protein [Ferroacidibacillus organovorans]|nr:hypothetical protein [Ferroacidibacillus organovorans]
MSRGHLNFFDFIFIGRTYDEYMRMFDLGEKDIAGSAEKLPL